MSIIGSPCPASPRGPASAMRASHDLYYDPSNVMLDMPQGIAYSTEHEVAPGEAGAREQRTH